jgi:hypothetical protein
VCVCVCVWVVVVGVGCDFVYARGVPASKLNPIVGDDVQWRTMGCNGVRWDAMAYDGMQWRAVCTFVNLCPNASRYGTD